MNKNNMMNKNEMVSAYAKKLNISKVDAEKRINDMIEFMGDVFEDKSCEGIQLVGNLTLTKVHKKERTGINPRTKEEIIIPAKTTAKVKFGTKLLEKLNK